jgi:hypothetical protein
VEHTHYSYGDPEFSWGLPDTIGDLLKDFLRLLNL